MPIALKNLEISLGRFHLGPLTANFEDSGLYLIRGKNGSGKTSLLRTLLGRLRKKSGEISGLRFPIASVGVEPLLMGSWTVFENLSWLSKLLKLKLDLPDEIRNLSMQRVDHLSMGLKRQVELSLMLTVSTPSLFLDEPLTALDLSQREFYAKKINSASEKKLVLLTTHFEESLFKNIRGTVEL